MIYGIVKYNIVKFNLLYIIFIINCLFLASCSDIDHRNFITNNYYCVELVRKFHYLDNEERKEERDAVISDISNFSKNNDILLEFEKTGVKTINGIRHVPDGPKTFVCEDYKYVVKTISLEEFWQLMGE